MASATWARTWDYARGDNHVLADDRLVCRTRAYRGDLADGDAEGLDDLVCRLIQQRAHGARVVALHRDDAAAARHVVVRKRRHRRLRWTPGFGAIGSGSALCDTSLSL